MQNDESKYTVREVDGDEDIHEFEVAVREFQKKIGAQHLLIMSSAPCNNPKHKHTADESRTVGVVTGNLTELADMICTVMNRNEMVEKLIMVSAMAFIEVKVEQKKPHGHRES